MRNLLFLFITITSLLNANGQDLTIATNQNWNGFAGTQTQVTWNYGLSSGWFFWAGAGLGFVALMLGWAVNFIRKETTIDVT